MLDEEEIASRLIRRERGKKKKKVQEGAVEDRLKDCRLQSKKKQKISRYLIGRLIKKWAM
jgi:hypothetical protein